MKFIFRHQIQHANEISTFAFEPTEPTIWTAGQSIRLELPAPDYGTNERRFTISSAPYERLIAITTRRSTSEFKQSLFALQPGDIVDGYSVEGDFVWQGEPAIFVAIGIGVTPFYAMLKQQLYQYKPLNAEFFYAGKHPLPFAVDFQSWQATHQEFKLHLLNHRLTAKSLQPFATNKLIYISGPQRFVAQLKQGLLETNTDENAIKTDLFTGNLPDET